MLIPCLIAGLAVLLPGCKNAEVERLQTELRLQSEQNNQLKEQLQSAQLTNAGLLNRLEDLSVISKEGATSIRESLQNINDQTAYIRDLNREMQRKDSLNMALVMNLKRSLDDVNDQAVQVEVRGGRVHVSISDQLLFASGSAQVNETAMSVLSKVALVLNDHRDLELIVEGHTDNVPVNIRGVRDNWELSTLRATAVVRALSDKFYVDPARLTAAGRAHFSPLGDNNTAEGRARNRRTEIVIIPKLEEFMKLLEQPGMAG